MQAILDGKLDEDAAKPESIGTFKHFGAFGKLDEQWCADFISKTSKMTVAALERAKAYDDNTIQMLMTFTLGMALGMRLPDVLKDKAIALDLFMSRDAEMGSRTKAWDNGYIAESGEIDWLKHGAYGLEWNAEKTKVSHIVHRASNAKLEVPPQAPIDAIFHMQANHSDTEAFVIFGRISQTLASFFEKGEGPFSYGVWSARPADLKRKSVAAQQRFMEQRSKAFAGNDDDGERFFEAETKRTKAREALARRKTELANKRRIKLSS